MFKHFAVAAALALAATSSFAADGNGFYAGADAGVSKLDEFDDNHASFGGFLGYGFTPNVALELGYRRLGHGDVNTYDVKVNQASLSVLGMFPLNPQLKVYGRLGASQLKIDIDGDRETRSRVLFGAGLQFDFDADVAARVEVQRPAANGTNLSAGVIVKF